MGSGTSRCYQEILKDIFKLSNELHLALKPYESEINKISQKLLDEMSISEKVKMANFITEVRKQL